MVQHFDIQNVLHKSKCVFGVYNELIQIYVLSQHFLRRHELYFQSCQHVFVIHVITLT